MRLMTALAPLALLMASPALAQDWAVDRAASSVGLQTDVFGSTLTGTFSEFEARITLDPDNLAEARIEAVINTASGQLSDASRQSDMTGEAGLAVGDHPEARFVSESVNRSGDMYEAAGTLTVKGNSQPVILRFSLTLADGRAIADGGFTVARADFGVGEAGWGAAAANVTVQVHIEADAVQPVD